MKKYSLVKSFTIFSFITFILTGIVLSFVISQHIGNDYYNNLYGVTQIVADNITENILAESDFNNTITETKKSLIEESIYKFMSLYKPYSVGIINNRKEIILTSQPTTDIFRTGDSEDASKILNGGMSYYISGVYTKTDADEISVFNLYVPIKYKENIEGALILQIPESAIKSHVNMLLKSIVLTLSGGLFILFLLLIRILYSASKTLQKQNSELIDQKAEIETAYRKLSASYKNTILALSNAVDARDTYTAGHSERVTKISLLIGKKIKLSEEELKKLEYAALFHDIGKIGISDCILLKNSRLTDQEFEVIQKHPEMGVNILKSIDFLKDILPIIKHHHEKYIGKGYPDNMKGDEIPLGARIIAVADTYDAMTSDRPYRKKLSHKIAVDEILNNKGSQFDGIIVEAFMAIEQYINNDLGDRI